MLLLLCGGGLNVNLDCMYYVLGGLQALGFLVLISCSYKYPLFMIVSRLIGFLLRYSQQ